MTKTLTLHQNLLGRTIKEDPKRAELIESMTFKYFGLTGTEMQIVAAWLDQGGLRVQVVDDVGYSRALYLDHFMLVPADKQKADMQDFLERGRKAQAAVDKLIPGNREKRQPAEIFKPAKLDAIKADAKRRGLLPMDAPTKMKPLVKKGGKS